METIKVAKNKQRMHIKITEDFILSLFHITFFLSCVLLCTSYILGHIFHTAPKEHPKVDLLSSWEVKKKYQSLTWSRAGCFVEPLFLIPQHVDGNVYQLEGLQNLSGCLHAVVSHEGEHPLGSGWYLLDGLLVPGWQVGFWHLQNSERIQSWHCILIWQLIYYLQKLKWEYVKTQEETPCALNTKNRQELIKTLKKLWPTREIVDNINLKFIRIQFCKVRHRVSLIGNLQKRTNAKFSPACLLHDGHHILVPALDD